jgi:GxxExxY protein
MPVGCAVPLRRVGDAAFEAIEYELNGACFDVHNEHGRLCDERIYRNLIAMECRRRGLDAVYTEVALLVVHDSFEKNYYLDLLIDGFLIVELKTVEFVTGEHRSQVINYLLLTGLRHAKLINMRSTSVDSKTERMPLTPEERRELNIRNVGGGPLSQRGHWFRRTIRDLLKDWGSFLSISLYREAIMHYLGGRDYVETVIDYVDGSTVVGGQRVRLLDEHTAFQITALKDDLQGYEMHLRRLFQHTPLKSIEWVNINNHDIMFTTIP